ncbi:MAG: integrase catalytic domain-containing protein [Saprospiraceae bacterium]|nr:integrase catalytic domain-containing protein [Candidatus Vicinibacter affinis]
MGIKFYLRAIETEDPTPIFYTCHINGKPISRGLGYKIYPGLWDKTRQRPTEDKELIKEYSAQDPHLKNVIKNIEIRINNIIELVYAYVNNCNLNKTPIDISVLDQLLKENVFQSKKTLETASKVRKVSKTGLNQNLVLDYSGKFLDGISRGKILIQSGPHKGNRYSEGTIKNYRNFVSIWTEFEKYMNIRYKWEDIKKPVYDSLVQFLNQRDYTKDTTGRYIKHLKTISQAALDEGIHSNLEFRKRYFETLKAKIDSISLDTKELEKIESLDLSGNESQDKARDLFLLMCYTALRISDIKRITKDHIRKTAKGEYRLEIITQKTRERVIVPINTKAYNILEKYGFDTPQIADQTNNEYIKQIAKMAGIDEIVSTSEDRGGTIQTRSVPKYELITNHTGRRTAATQMYLSKIPSIDIMKITGHKTESSFMKYIRITKEETADRMAENEFFK